MYSRKSEAEPGDLDSELYAVLKFCACDYLDGHAARHELEVHKHLSIANPSHHGKHYIQTMGGQLRSHKVQWHSYLPSLRANERDFINFPVPLEKEEVSA